MIRVLALSYVCLLALSSSPAAQEPLDTGLALVKQARAVRIEPGAVRLDGRLDDRAWQAPPTITDFVQKEPIEGIAPSHSTEIWIGYDNTALYIAARMHSGSTIQRPMGRRDSGEEQAEHILIALDTFLDRRTAYGFGVTASGVRLDRYYPQDDEVTFDEGFDPVWEARTNIEENGWTAELWIPFSQLRFNDQVTHVWGLNLMRFTPSLNEFDYWVPVPRTQKAWASRFGELLGIENIPRSKRIELLPYVAGGSTVDGNRDAANPFDSGANLTSRAGMDVKMGIGPNLTLEATVNPDFGQVEADPAEVNLTAFETFFTEKRPFFTEGAGLLSLSSVNNFFYSRRIGAPPTMSVVGDYTDLPQTATILTAAKLTGRLPSGTSIGLLGALTGEESARAFNRATPEIQAVPVAARTAYGVGLVRQEFGRSASTFSLGTALLHRDLNPEDPLSALLVRNSVTVAGESRLRLKGGEYEVESVGLGTWVGGEPGAVERIQRNSVHYLQRPDKDYAPFDPTRTQLPGYKGSTSVERVSGRHWLWRIYGQAESPGYEPNEVGRLAAGDGFQQDATLKFRETLPGRIFRNYSIGLTESHEWNYGGDHTAGWLTSDLNLTWKNFWTTVLSVRRTHEAVDQRLTRGGPLMGTPAGWITSLQLRNSLAAQTSWTGQFSAEDNALGGQVRRVNATVSFRPGPRWQLSISPTYSNEVVSQQYVTALDGGRPETFGTRYIFSFVDRNTVSAAIRMNYSFKPDVTLDVYAEPFAASGRYYDFGELPAPRLRDVRLYGTSGTTMAVDDAGRRMITDGAASFTLRNYDFNVRSFRSNVVLRWEWRPGSTLYLVWQQDRNTAESLGDHAGLTDLFGAFKRPGTNIFVIKSSFWLSLK